MTLSRLGVRSSGVWMGVGIGLFLHLLTWVSVLLALDTLPTESVVRRLYPGVGQWVYLLPAAWLAGLRRRADIAKGILAFGVFGLLCNLVLAVVPMG